MNRFYFALCDNEHCYDYLAICAVVYQWKNIVRKNVHNLIITIKGFKFVFVFFNYQPGIYYPFSLNVTLKGDRFATLQGKFEGTLCIIYKENYNLNLTLQKSCSNAILLARMCPPSSWFEYLLMLSSGVLYIKSKIAKLNWRRLSEWSWLTGPV